MEITQSKMFNEFILKRCEEIIMDDPVCIEMNNRILELESSIKKTLSPEQIKSLLEYESEVMRLNSHIEQLVYKKGFLDFK
jgi:hypothetical protein